MKKTVAFIIAMVMALAMIPASAAIFTDIDSGHWAFGAISRLVDQGTIGGYTDGSFKPNNTVTRAEFVKMVGEGPKAMVEGYDDVPEDHWAYKYVITSGFPADENNNFNPNVAITRAQTVQLLYSRFGVAGVKAPDFVKKEAAKYGISAHAISWIYSYGVLVGNDGANLRLGDTLTRAEAAALIIKCADAENQKSFMSIVSEDILEKTFNTINAFEEPYSSDKTVTNGQLAEAAMKFADNAVTVDYSKYYVNQSIDHKNSKALYVLCKVAVGMDNFTVEYADKTATFETAEKAFKMAAERLNAGNIKEKAMLYAQDEKNASEAVTHKEIAALMLQYDAVYGSQFGYTTEIRGEEFTRVNFKIENDTAKYPETHADYAVILKDVPGQVYDFARASEGSGTAGTPAQLYDFARDYSALFTAKCAQYVTAAEEVFGAKILITFYPSMAYSNGTGFAFRVKVKALNDADCTPADLFGEAAITNADIKLTTGMEFYVEIAVESII